MKKKRNHIENTLIEQRQDIETLAKNQVDLADLQEQFEKYSKDFFLIISFTLILLLLKSD